MTAEDYRKYRERAEAGGLSNFQMGRVVGKGRVILTGDGVRTVTRTVEEKDEAIEAAIDSMVREAEGDSMSEDHPTKGMCGPDCGHPVGSPVCDKIQFVPLSAWETATQVNLEYQHRLQVRAAKCLSGEHEKLEQPVKDGIFVPTLGGMYFAERGVPVEVVMNVCRHCRTLYVEKA